MGYELHITRARDWLESAESPISREEWEAVARRHPAVQGVGVSYSGDLASQPIFSITGSDAGEASLRWDDAQVYVKGDYGDDVQQAILTLAEELQALLLGDEEELYFTDAYEHPDTGERVPYRFRTRGPQPRRTKRTRWWSRRNTNA